MKVLVVGTVPPPGGARAGALARLAADRLAAGNEVFVWSPDTRSAAHDGGSLSGVRLPLRLAAASRSFDGVVLRIEPGLPFASSERRVVRTALLVMLGLALKRFEEVVIVLDSPIAIPWGVGGRATKELWSRAHVIVENDDDRVRLLAVPWLDEQRVEVVPPRPAPEPAPPRAWPGPDAGDLRGAVLSVVRARAAASRRLEEAGAAFERAPFPPERPELAAFFEAAPGRGGASPGLLGGLAPLARLGGREALGRLRRLRG